MQEAQYEAVIMKENFEKNVVYGLMRECVQSVESYPIEIVELIWKWCSDYFVHLFNVHNQEHWKINMAELLQH